MKGIGDDLQKADAREEIPELDRDSGERVLLQYGGSPRALLEISRRGDEPFGEEIAGFEEMIDEEGTQGVNEGRVLNAPRDCREILAIQVLHNGRSTEETLRLYDPLWNWPREDLVGVAQADGEGFCTRERELIRRRD